MVIVASIVGVMLAIFIPDIFLKPFCFGQYGDPGCSWYNSLAGTVWALAALIVGQIIWHKQEKPDEEYYGMVYFAQSSSKLEEIYWESIAKGGKGYIDLSTEEIKAIVEK